MAIPASKLDSVEKLGMLSTVAVGLGPKLDESSRLAGVLVGHGVSGGLGAAKQPASSSPTQLETNSKRTGFIKDIRPLL
jgi:hypothetical protein